MSWRSHTTPEDVVLECHRKGKWSGVYFSQKNTKKKKKRNWSIMNAVIQSTMDRNTSLWNGSFILLVETLNPGQPWAMWRRCYERNIHTVPAASPCWARPASKQEAAKGLKVCLGNCGREWGLGQCDTQDDEKLYPKSGALSASKPSAQGWLWVWSSLWD